MRRKAENLSVVVVTIVAVSILLAIAPWMYDTVVLDVPSSSPAGDLAQLNVSGNVYTGMSVMSILPIIQFAAIIFGLLGLVLYMRR